MPYAVAYVGQLLNFDQFAPQLGKYNYSEGYPMRWVRPPPGGIFSTLDLPVCSSPLCPPHCHLHMVKFSESSAVIRYR